jgi:hypothetical protein
LKAGETRPTLDRYGMPTMGVGMAPGVEYWRDAPNEYATPVSALLESSGTLLGRRIKLG